MVKLVYIVLPSILAVMALLDLIRAIYVKNQEMHNPIPKHNNDDKRFKEVEKKKTHQFLF